MAESGCTGVGNVECEREYGKRAVLRVPSGIFAAAYQSENVSQNLAKRASAKRTSNELG
ncbi:hypothetical protein K435DRAFT_772924, partial [Dendrothele bispora CBS 962.96]